MAEFNDHPTELLREWDATEQLQRTHEAYEALTASEVLRVEPMPNQAPTPPQVARLDRAFVALPFVVLALVLALLLAGCRSDRRTTTGTSSTTTQAVVGAVSTAVAGIAPATNATPVFVWNFANSPTPTPSATPDTECSHIGLCGWDVLQGGGR